MRVDHERCFILHRRAYRESSLILELFSIDHGRIAAVARGARAARSPMRGLTEPFVELLASWVRRGEMATLTGLETAAEPSARYSRRALWCGLYINELLLRLLARDDPEPGLFDCYADVLEKLHHEQDQARLLRGFELNVLQSSGVAPDLATCSSGQPVSRSGSYRVDPGLGPVPVQRSAKDAVDGTLLIALTENQALNSAQAQQAKRLMRLLIEHQLDGRKLQTPKMFGRPA